jgi:hypothetical protein
MLGATMVLQRCKSTTCITGPISPIFIDMQKCEDGKDDAVKQLLSIIKPILDPEDEIKNIHCGPSLKHLGETK